MYNRLIHTQRGRRPSVRIVLGTAFILWTAPVVSALRPDPLPAATTSLDRVGTGKAIAAACNFARTNVDTLSAKYRDLNDASAVGTLVTASQAYKDELDRLVAKLSALRVTPGVDGGNTKKLIDVLSARTGFQAKLVKGLQSAKSEVDVKKVKANLTAERATGSKAAQVVATEMKAYGYLCSVLPKAK